MLHKASETTKTLGLETAWSLWAELGLSGWTRRHSDTLIDLEPLIIATSYLGTWDSRLLEEALDWCVLNSRFVSSIRLGNLLKSAKVPVRKAFGHFAASVGMHRKISWPSSEQPLELSLTRRSSLPGLGRPALLQLRLRALLGVSARAEILRSVLLEPERFFNIAELAAGAAYGRDNVADTLEMLVLAGAVRESTMTAAGGHKVFRCAPSGELTKVLGTLPRDRPDWQARFRVMLELADFATADHSGPLSRAAAVYELIQALKPELSRLAVLPQLSQGAVAVNEDFDRWSQTTLGAWAGLEPAGKAADRRLPKTTKPSPRS